MSEIKIRPAVQADIAEVSDILGAAFADEPYIRSMFGTGAQVARQASEYFYLQLSSQYYPKGVVDVAVIDGDIAGAALWAPPGSSAGSLSSQAKLLGQYAKLIGKKLAGAIMSELAAHKMAPAFPHWYLYILGVEPQYRGKGVGMALLKHKIAEVGEHNACYLEATTPASARLYNRVGFVPMGEVHLTKTEAILGMWRPADAGMSDFDGTKH